jgi:exonuclease SbcD
MKLLHLADLHIGRYFNGLSLLEDQKEMLNQIIRIIKEEDPQVVIIAGDIYDRSIPREDAVKANDGFLTELVKLGKKNILITGNHDSHERVGFLSSLLEDRGLMVENNVRRPLRCLTLKDEIGPVEIYLFPYRDTANLKTIYELETFRDDTLVYERIFKESVRKNSNRKILVYHGFVAGTAREEVEESESERILSVGGHDFIKTNVFEPFNYVALGHLHKPQWVVEGKIRYSGSPMKYSFSEEKHKKSISVIDLAEDGSVSLKEIPLVHKKDVVTIQGTFSEIMNMEYEGNPEDYIRVILKDREEILEPMMRLRAKFPNILELQRERDQKEILNNYSDYSIIQKKDMTKLFKDFYRLKNDRDIPEENLKIIKDLVETMEGGDAS